MVKEEKLSVYYLGLTFKEKKMKKLIMMLLMIGFGYSQSLPQPIIVGEELDYPTLKISQFVKVDESVGIRDDKVSLGIKQLVEESFQDTRYRLVEDDNADFTANVEVLYIGKCSHTSQRPYRAKSKKYRKTCFFKYNCPYFYGLELFPISKICSPVFCPAQPVLR